MMNMYGGTGMGASGMGAAPGPMMPGSSGLSPQLMAMLAQMQGSGAGQGTFQAPPGPMQASPTGTPMAGYIGGGAPAMGHPMGAPMPMGQPPGMNGSTPPGATPMAGVNPQMMQMLQAIKGQQGGLPANGMAQGQPTGALPGNGPGAMAGQQPSALANQMATAQPIGAAGTPSAGMAPQGGPATGMANPGLMAYLQHLLSGGGGMPQAPVSQ